MLAKRFALGFGIAIIFPAMIHFGVGTISPQPKWENYQTENYNEKHLFYFAVPLGILAIIVGAYLPHKVIGAGLMFGGIFSATDGYFNYWRELSDALKFSSSLCAFIVLLIIGYLKIEEKKT
jgi:hypothetical protein